MIVVFTRQAITYTFKHDIDTKLISFILLGGHDLTVKM